MEIRAGTSGYSYPEWKGGFYPAKLPAAAMLAYYAERLPAVELNNTFYRMPRSGVVASWAAQVPETFRFAVKVSQRITHRKRLQDVEEDLDYLLVQLEPLGARLGPLLVQLPPNFPRDTGRLARFLGHLAGRARAAFEFRSETWLEDDVFACLQEHGAALVASETDETPAALRETTRFGYLRLRRSEYTAPELAAWMDRVRPLAWQEAFVFFKHEIAGPALADQFNQLARRAIPVRPAVSRAREAG